jgi:hypothetical protein
MPTREEQDLWEEHVHEAIVHSHPHYHVTHNYNERVGGFDHLSSYHEHEHDHAEMRHSHYPHRNFDVEHSSEAHVHDHDVPVKKVTREKVARTSRASGRASKAMGEPVGS